VTEAPNPEPAQSADDDDAAAVEEYEAQRAAWANKASKGVLAAVLCLEAVVILLVPRTIAFTTGLGPVRLTIVIVLAVLLVLGAGLVRRPWGIAVGSGLQVAFFATGIMIVTMFVIAAVFIAVWVRVLMFRHEALGTPGGVHMLLG
jgi:Protein of unknown function (DUF4233)